MTGLTGDDALRRRLRAITDTRQLLGQVALLGVREARLIARRDFTKTANLEGTIRVEGVTETSAKIVAGGTSAVGYAVYVERGTGIYGPRKRKIVPKTKKLLAWQGGGSRLTGRGPGSGWRFAKSVRGRKATPYLVPGVQQAVKRSGVGNAVVKAWDDAA